MRKNPSQTNVALGDRPPASMPSRPAAGPGASKPCRRVFNTPRKTGGVTLLKLPPRCRRSLGIKRSPQRTTANRNVPAAAEFCTKVTCFNYEKFRDTKIQKARTQQTQNHPITCQPWASSRGKAAVTPSLARLQWMREHATINQRPAAASPACS